jgi:dihydroneopterin aldolase
MPFFGYHGVFPEENKLGQRFVVSMDLYVNLAPAGASDDVADTVNYGEVYDLVKAIVEGPHVRLIETLAEKIAQSALCAFPKLSGVRVDVEKPGAPVVGVLDTVCVQIERWRE